MQQPTTALTMEDSKVGLCINPEKCKVFTTTKWNDHYHYHYHMLYYDIRQNADEITKITKYSD